MLRIILKQIKAHKFVYILLSAVLIGATFVRVYNTQEILGFYYDQGRDALVIWNFIHKGDLFLVGPTTGIEGILRGPWYYWLITPFYFIGRGDPVWPANFLAITSVIAIFLLYLVAKEIFDRTTGLIAVTIASFSYFMLVASRWLSNPTPMLLISMVLAISLIWISKGKKWAWVVTGAMLALAIQFGSAAEIFYIPAVLVFAFLERKNLPDRKILFVSIVVIFLIFLPQILFNTLKGGILVQSIKRFLVEEQSFKLSFWEVVKIRIPFYWTMFSSKIWISDMNQFLPYSLATLAIIVFNFTKLWKKSGFRILVILGLAPLFGMIFFQGNEGRVFDYYFTGYYLIHILLFSAGLGILGRSKFGLIFVLLFFFLFFKGHLSPVKNYLIYGRSNVNLKEQLMAIDWVYKDANGRDFNVDVYVPPIIPYAYDYLFTWQSKKYGYPPKNTQVDLLYTFYEDDGGSRFLKEWKGRQDKIGRTEGEVIFRGLIVQRRNRFN